MSNKFSLLTELTTKQALALAQLLKRLDNDVFERYSHPSESHLAQQAIEELKTSLKEAGFNPR